MANYTDDQRSIVAAICFYPDVMRKLIKAWWEGEYIPYTNDPNSDIVVIGGRTRRHWTSRFGHVLVEFLRKEWKWALGFLVAVVGLVVAVARLPS